MDKYCAYYYNLCYQWQETELIMKVGRPFCWACFHGYWYTTI